MSAERTKAAIRLAIGAAIVERDDHAYAILNALLDAMDAGLTESLADAVGEWDADQDREARAADGLAWARRHDGRPTR